MGGAGNTGKKKKITFLFLAVLLQEIKNKAKGMGFWAGGQWEDKKVGEGQLLQ